MFSGYKDFFLIKIIKQRNSNVLWDHDEQYDDYVIAQVLRQVLLHKIVQLLLQDDQHLWYIEEDHHSDNMWDQNLRR